jgi:hypothetical protein
MTDWSFDNDIQRYERLLAQLTSRQFWIGEKPGRPTEEELRGRSSAYKKYSPNSVMRSRIKVDSVHGQTSTEKKAL